MPAQLQFQLVQGGRKYFKEGLFDPRAGIRLGKLKLRLKAVWQ